MIKPLEWFKGTSRSNKIGTSILASFFSLVAIVVAAPPPPEETPTASVVEVAQPAAQAEVKDEPVIETKQVTETASVDFKTIEQEDGSLDKGKTNVEQDGRTGERTIIYEVTYEDGREVSRKKVSDDITTPARDKVVSVGTYVAPSYSASPTPSNCPNGTYTNSAGNVVCSPYSAPSIPAGATAKCGDGTYSFSQSRRGTCSHHGGVSVWY